MELRAGSRLKSAVCDTEVIAVKAPAEDIEHVGLPDGVPGAEAEAGDDDGDHHGHPL